MMAILGPEGKRQRMSSWSGPSQQQPMHDQHMPYPGHALPPLPVVPATYPEQDHRGALPNGAYTNGSGYTTPMDGANGQYAPDPAYARAPGGGGAGTPIKTGSPGEAQPTMLRSMSLPVAADASHPVQPSPMEQVTAQAGYGDHPTVTVDTHQSLQGSGHEAVAHTGAYAASPISAGPRDAYYMNAPYGGYPARRKAVRAAQVRSSLDSSHSCLKRSFLAGL